jgi:hypothetical protein
LPVTFQFANSLSAQPASVIVSSFRSIPVSSDSSPDQEIPLVHGALTRATMSAKQCGFPGELAWRKNGGGQLTPGPRNSPALSDRRAACPGPWRGHSSSIEAALHILSSPARRD